MAQVMMVMATVVGCMIIMGLMGEANIMVETLEMRRVAFMGGKSIHRVE